MHRFLNDLGREVRAGKIFDACTKVIFDDPNYPFYFGPVGQEKKDELFRIAGFIYRNFDFPALQFVFPDIMGLFPFDPGCDPKFKKLQGLMGDVSQTVPTIDLRPESGGIEQSGQAQHEEQKARGKNTTICLPRSTGKKTNH
jgi:hypothetical protein